MPLEDFMFPFTDSVQRKTPARRAGEARARQPRRRRRAPRMLSSALLALRSLLP